MTTLLTYVLGLLLVGGLLFLVASFTFGRGEEMVPALPEGTPVELPDDRLADGGDLRALRLSVVLRGYRMDEVDWLLDRLAEQVDARDREIRRLRSVLHVEPVTVGGGDPAAERVAGRDPGPAVEDRHPAAGESAWDRDAADRDAAEWEAADRVPPDAARHEAAGGATAYDERPHGRQREDQ